MMMLDLRDPKNTDMSLFVPPVLANYSNEELERLSTLSVTTARPGETLMVWGVRTFKLQNGGVVYRDGNYESADDAIIATSPERRVMSFSDARFIDPPIEEMIAELDRRKAEAEREAREAAEKKKRKISNITHAGVAVRCDMYNYTGRVVSMNMRKLVDGMVASPAVTVVVLKDTGELTWTPPEMLEVIE